MRLKKAVFLLFGGSLLALISSGFLAKQRWSLAEEIPRRAEILFLGNTATHHNSGKYAPSLAIDLYARGIHITYTTDTGDLNPATLSKYDGLMIYANYDSINTSQDKALKEFVEGGKGLIALHSASYCFRNSAWYVQAVGAQFKSHQTGVFSAKTINSEHPVMKGVEEFSSWDETYIHSNLNPDKTVLQERVEGSAREPWTWVRNQGKGRVFYTAGGHDDSTWTKPDFVKMIGNGVLWAVGDKIAARVAAFKPPVLRYNDTSIVPNYPRPVPYTSKNERPSPPRYQYALTAEESMKTLSVPVGFELKLFASEPDITNPISMSWDEKGRLWVIESVDYPNTYVETDGATNDRIKICEDTNGDGRADKFTIFADKLNIPTSLVFTNGGVVVSMAPSFLFLKDTNGDDKADIRQTIGSGWGKTDTHAGPSNLQYGFDNKIWGTVGYSGYSGKIDGTNNGVNPSQALFRLNTTGTGLEFLAQSTNNTWGLGFTEDNHVFVSTANNDHSDYYSMPARFMQRSLAPAVLTVAGTPGSNAGLGRTPTASVAPLHVIQGHGDMHTLTPNLRQVDWQGGFTAAAGHHFYTARSFPKEYWNRIALINEPTGRLVHRGVIERKGAGFTEKDGWNLIAGNDEWFGPVHAEVGPDGAVWIADWYNYIIQHNPTPGPRESLGKQFATGQGGAYVTPMRDIQYGRIYRIIYKNAKPYTPVRLSKTDLPGLISGLKNDNMFWRMNAQRLIVESKNLALLPELYKIINDQKVDEIGLNSPAVHAIWTLQGLNVLNGTNTQALAVVKKALSHPAAGVRRAAAEVLPKTLESANAILKAGLISDKDLNTRMHALLLLAELPASAEIGKALYTASLNDENAADEWIAKALFAAVINNQKTYAAAAPAALFITGSAPAASDTALSLPQRIMRSLANETYSYTIASVNRAADPARSRRADPLPIDVKGKELSLRATIGPRGGSPGVNPSPVEGFIIGQGGIQNGYGLFIQDGKVNFVVKQDGKTYKAITKDALPDRYALLARLAADGTMTIQIDQKQAALAKAPAMFTKTVAAIVRTGSDNPPLAADKMGDYQDAFPFTGTAQGLAIDLKTSNTPDPAGKPGGPPTAVTKSTTLVLDINIVPEAMKFDVKQFEVKAGQKVILNVNNPDPQQHNLVIAKIGTLSKVGAAATAMISDPGAAAKGYVPDIPEVLFYTQALNADASYTLEFIAPSQPGDYPFLCTFPGHWSMMNGIMKVVR